MTRNDPEWDPFKTSLAPLETADIRLFYLKGYNPVTDFRIMKFRLIPFGRKALAPGMGVVDAQVTPARLTQLLEEGKELLWRHRELLGTAALVGGLPDTVDGFSQAGE